MRPHATPRHKLKGNAEMDVKRADCTQGADKSLARPNSRCILFDGENVSCDASLIYIYMYIYIYMLAEWLRHCANSRAVPGSNPGGVGHRDFSRGYRQNHVPWGQLSL